MTLNKYEYKLLLAGLIADATQDALAFGKIVDIGKNEFKLDGLKLEEFVKSIISNLLEQGMQIVNAAPIGSEFLWFKHTDYMLLAKENAVVELIAQWKAVDDYDFMVWFVPLKNLTDRPGDGDNIRL